MHKNVDSQDCPPALLPQHPGVQQPSKTQADTSSSCDAGHDEDEEKAKIGTPLERVLLMANAMLDAIKIFKSPDGKALRIRIGRVQPATASNIQP